MKCLFQPHDPCFDWILMALFWRAWNLHWGFVSRLFKTFTEVCVSIYTAFCFPSGAVSTGSGITTWGWSGEVEGEKHNFQNGGVQKEGLNTQMIKLNRNGSKHAELAPIFSTDQSDQRIRAFWFLSRTWIDWKRCGWKKWPKHILLNGRFMWFFMAMNPMVQSVKKHKKQIQDFKTCPTTTTTSPRFEDLIMAHP